MDCSTKTFNTTRGFVGLGWAIFCPKGTLALRGVFTGPAPKVFRMTKSLLKIKTKTSHVR